MKELDNLDLKYKFYNVNNINISIGVDSLQKLKNYNIINKIKEIVDFNEYHIKEQLQNVLINRKNYVSYCKEFDYIVNKIKSEYSKDVLLQLTLLFKILFYRLKKKKAKMNFQLNILVSYKSPAGRNYYERRFIYDYDDLVKIMSNHKKTDISEGVNKLENIVPSKELNHFIKCVQCSKLISSTSKYCCYCGKKQADKVCLNSFDVVNQNEKEKNNSSEFQQKSNSDIYNLKENKNFIVETVDNSEKFDSMPSTSKTETLKQSKQYLECNHCGRLIDFKLNVCNYCGMIQFGNSEYLNQDKISKERITTSYNVNNKNSFQAYDDNFCLNRKKDNSSETLKKTSNNFRDLEENKKNEVIDIVDNNLTFNMVANNEKTNIINSSKKTNIEDNTQKSKKKDNAKKNNLEEYIKKHFYDCVLFNYKTKVKLDDGTCFYEEIADSLCVKTKNTKREIALLDYYRDKYLNKNINNYNIYNVRFDWKYWHEDSRCIYFDCKCNKCGRLIFQTAHNFILHPIICKCSDKKYIHLAEIDFDWDKKLFPYRKRVSSIYDDNDFYDIYMEKIFNLYFDNYGVIKRMGFSSINEFKDKETYIIGNVSIPLKDKYITFENVYYNYFMEIPKETKNMFLETRKNVIYNPILYFYNGNNHYNFELLKKEGLSINKTFDSFVFIYFSKEKDNYKMNVYYNDNLIFSKQINSQLKINTIYNNNILDLNSFREFGYDNEINDHYNNITDYVFFTKFDNDSSVSRYRFNISDKTMYPYNLNNEKRKLELKELIDRTKINITINLEKVTPNLRKQIESFRKIDNNKYKRIFIHKTAYETGWILYEFLNDKSEVLVLENEFLDDKSLNYCFLIEKDNREVLNFVDYIISRSRDHKSYECNTYEHSISSICNILLEKEENVAKIIDAILKDDILIFDNKEKEDYVISKLKNKTIFKDYHNDYYILKFSYYKEIILELKKKYCVDDFGLLLIMLIKYGEDVIFDLNERYFIKKTEEPEFDKLYNELLIRSNYKNPKWKNEYNLYLLIKTYFNDAIFQYKFKELGEQSIDIFIPSLNIAFEYQGEQHYVSGIFGDESDFEHSKWLDERKRKICQENNIHLIEWHFETRVNKIELDYALYEFKELLTNKYEFSNIVKK